jgi:protein O-mannosyl-transferase
LALEFFSDKNYTMSITEHRNNRGLLPGAIVASLVTLLMFLTARGNEFLELDDLGYIIDNRHIDHLNWQTVVWAFTSFHEANWHPLTMLSLALDRQVWGLNPFGFHLTNILLHCGTVFCACFLFASILKRIPSLKGTPGRGVIVGGSIAASLFFGIHPLRVESVVWASERKDDLCILFFTAAVWWHLRYAALRSARPGDHLLRFRSWWLVLLMALLSLLSKPTAVSLPLVLLIVDWFPLGRLSGLDGLLRAVAEKLPLFLMVAATAVLTVFAQQEPMSIASDLNLASRLLVACKALICYVSLTLWPAGLAPLYLHPGNVAQTALGEYLPYVAVIAAVSLAVAVLARRQRIWTALWLYYLVTLAPMLGIVQVGGQWMADRYTYVPALALSLVWGGGGAWLVARLRDRGRRGAALLLTGIAVGQLVSYGVITLRQIRVWRTTETLASREIELMPHQIGAAYHARARYLNELGEYDRALVDSDEALAIALRKNLRSKYAELSITQARILRNLGRLPEALAAAEWAIRTSTVDPSEYVRFRDEVAQELNRSRDNP